MSYCIIKDIIGAYRQAKKISRDMLKANQSGLYSPSGVITAE